MQGEGKFAGGPAYSRSLSSVFLPRPLRLLLLLLLLLASSALLLLLMLGAVCLRTSAAELLFPAYTMHESLLTHRELMGRNPPVTCRSGQLEREKWSASGPGGSIIAGLGLGFSLGFSVSTRRKERSGLLLDRGGSSNPSVSSRRESAECR